MDQTVGQNLFRERREAKRLWLRGIKKSLKQNEDFNKEVGEPLFVIDWKGKNTVRHIPVTHWKYPVIPACGINCVHPQVSNKYCQKFFPMIICT